jgi:hypothetical protein
VKLILSEKTYSNQPSFFDNEPIGKRLNIKSDPIERIFRKISLRTVTGPYGEGDLRPVNDPGESLGAVIKSFYRQLESAGLIEAGSGDISFWPDGRGFAVAVTHDVDIISRSVKGSIRLLFKKDVQGGAKGLIDAILSSMGLAKNPYEGIPGWVKKEKEMGIRSTFFIFPGNRSNKNDPKYKLDALKKSIGEINSAGFDLALHTGIECYKGDNLPESREILSRFADISIKGIRPHYLSASFPEYWRATADCGFEYSSSVGFDREIGYFNGMDLPFVPFDVEKNRPLDMVEIPLAIMDCGLLGDRGEKIGAAIDSGKDLIARTKKTGGILVMDWHQRTMYQRDYPGWAEILFKLLDYARNEGAIFITLEEAAEHLRNRMSGR